jgi:GNAT superfamily N-acetyltransferase
VKLRFAIAEDVPRIVELGRMMREESRFVAMPYAEEKLSRNLYGLLGLQNNQQTHCCLVATNEANEIIGCLIGALEEFFFTNAKSANSILLWVTPRYRGSSAAVKLIGAFRDWANMRSADELCIAVASGVTIRRTDRFLRRLGFVQTGGNYMMPLKSLL